MGEPATPPTTPPAPAPAPAAEPPKTYTQADFDRLSAESEGHRKAGETATAKLKTLEQAAMTAGERTTAELADEKAKNAALVTERDSLRVATAFSAAARAAGAVYPEQLARFANEGELKLNAKGEIEGVANIINRLKVEFPALFGAGGGSADGRAGQGAAALPGGMNAMIRGRAGR